MERDRFCNAGMIIWEEITINVRTPLHVFSSGYMAGQRYREEVLKAYVRHFRSAYRCLYLRTVIVQICANVDDKFLKSEDIERIL